MQNEIYDEKNGLTYMLCGDYYLPELALTDIEPTYGKYGMLRKSYLQEHRKAKYQILLLQGKLVEHLNQIDAEARDREEQLVKQMMEKQGITEKLKRQDNMEWTRRMNVICHDAEEMILTEMIYTKDNELHWIARILQPGYQKSGSPDSKKMEVRMARFLLSGKTKK